MGTCNPKPGFQSLLAGNQSFTGVTRRQVRMEPCWFTKDPRGGYRVGMFYDHPIPWAASGFGIELKMMELCGFVKPKL